VSLRFSTRNRPRIIRSITRDFNCHRANGFTSASGPSPTGGFHNVPAGHDYRSRSSHERERQFPFVLALRHLGTARAGAYFSTALFFARRILPVSRTPMHTVTIRMSTGTKNLNFAPPRGHQCRQPP
jgi:hypothetical protein